MDKLDLMQAFIAVAQQGSFTSAAEKLGASTQLISKYVSQLESELKVRLLHRTTRSVTVTEAGLAYLERAQQILSDIDALEGSIKEQGDEPKGRLRISAPMSFSTLHLGKPLADFQQQYEAVTIDLQLNDRKVDIVEEGFDLAIRIGQLESSSLIARKISPIHLMMCASPEYLAKHGEPQSLEDLQGHRYLHYSYRNEDLPALVSTKNKGLILNKQKGSIVANNGEVLTKAAVAGAGIVLQPTFIVGPYIAQGKLKPILTQYKQDPLGLYAVYPHRKYLSAKVRSFIDHLQSFFGDRPYWDDF
ncbi:LysR family transcriptional regulator [Kangiella profundi]|uniref:LysR family transcriptional regulator n=1 Tax=Kangiella profundi TaxID=1561924 RepID=A0A2K9ABM0_9GAMM|nr:LysR family transcriptional regulator [Kangiella profundi]AUD78817.1 LysR family transcriptional regulator [Kangiella profundi]GGF03924.1 LysR family transcriptional regulator [Kangiella profundi]